MGPMRYESLLKKVLQDGEERTDRTGVGTRSLFAPPPIKHNLEKDGLPITTTKKVAWQWALRELSWMLQGRTDLEGLGPARKIWEPWADENGQLGPVYGHQFRKWGGDQLRNIANLLNEQPDTRRAVISLWNVDELEDMGLPPCPMVYHFSRRDDNRLDLHVYQRSADLFLGVPFDLVSQGAFLQLMAEHVGAIPSQLTVSYGDAHIYSNHLDQVKEMVRRWEDGEAAEKVVRLELPTGGLWGFDIQDVKLHGYEPMGALSGEIAV